MYVSIEKICEHCHKFYLGNSKSKYCGYDCSHAARQKKVTIVCQECNKEFKRQFWNSDAKFCSYKCKVKNQSSNIIDVTCTNCSTIFHRKEHLTTKNKSGNQFCSKKCSDKFNTGSNHYEWKEHLRDKNYKLALKQWSLKIKERDKYTCQLCGELDRNILESHHIKSRSKFLELQFDFNNGITLCLNCHALQHTNDPKSLRLITHKINKWLKINNN